ncbi:MAG: cysteine desulfurase family protein [Alphaproteobacteria bacterium]|nr:cysteine desulfurase family protein [Alphaproteobacteria bacterium]
MAKGVIYLDYAATTPLDPRVAAAMEPYWHQRFGNAHSSSHSFGWEAEEAVIAARRQVAAAIGANPREIVFTSGATEANNLALLGLARGLAAQGMGETLLMAARTEHPSITRAIDHLVQNGCGYRPLPVERSGAIPTSCLADLEPSSCRNLILSVMAVNNETGVIQPIAEIRRAVAAAFPKARIFLLVDAAQAVGRIAVNPATWGADLVSLSSHKFYGPKGIGLLYIRREIHEWIEPLVYGGGQEKSLRPGSLPVPLIVGMGEAASLASHDPEPEEERLARLANLLCAGLKAAGIRFHRNGGGVAGIINLQLLGQSARDFVAKAPRLALSLGSACHHAELAPSPSLLAMGLSPEQALSSFRLCLGRYTTESEVIAAVDEISQAAD